MSVVGMLRTMANEVIPIVAAVDDDFRVRESIESLLESAGYAPVVFSSAEEFLGSGTLLFGARFELQGIAVKDA